MVDRTQQIIDALKDTPDIKWISDSWPTAKAVYPCIVVDLASERNTDRRDDRPYLGEYEYYVRIFAVTRPPMLRILEEIDKRMAGIGYERTFRHEQNEPGVKQWVMRYRTAVYADA